MIVLFTFMNLKEKFCALSGPKAGLKKSEEKEGCPEHIGWL